MKPIALALLLVLASLFARVDVATKVLWRQLRRLREGRGVGLAWRAAWAFALSGVPAIAGGSSLSESVHAAGYVFQELDESESSWCREQVTVLSGQNLKVGAVIGRVTTGIGRASVPTVSGTGNGTISAVTAGPDVEVGSYVIKCTAAATDGGAFSVTAPSGLALPNATVGTPYVSSHLNFTLNDGSTDFIVNDSFTVVVGTTAPLVVGTGNGTISGLSLGPEAMPGNYKVICTVAATNAATFQILAPNGESLGSQALSGSGATAAFTTPQINCTVTDGATDFAVGDVFNVCVFNQLSGGKAVAWDPLTYDGRHRAAGILWADTDATGGDTAATITARGTVVVKAKLVWATAVKTAQQAAALKQLAVLGIIAR